VGNFVVMSDWPPAEPPPTPPGPPGPPAPGWWLASDGNYYPPEQAPRAQVPAPPTFTAYPTYGAPMAQVTTNGLAIASMVLGILWLWWVGSILAIVFGFVAKGQIDRSAGRQGGRGMAIAGIVLGSIGLAALAVLIVIGLAVGDDINTDPSDGFCNEDRFVQDPDC
jgi:hypothetical protein